MLVELEGAGVLLVGPSGIGKSECALELVRRGHRLIADDAVELSVTPQGALVGRAGAIGRGMIGIRGLGLLHLPDLAGPESIGDEAVVELICRLSERGEDAGRADRVGAPRAREDWLGVSLPRVTLCVPSVANVATLVETALRDLRASPVQASGVAPIDARLRSTSIGVDAIAAGGRAR